MSIEDILNAYKEKSQAPEPVRSDGKLDGKTATKKVWNVLKGKIDKLSEESYDEGEILPYMCLEWEFVGNYIFNMMGLANALAQNGDTMAGLAVQQYKEAWEVLKEQGEDIAGIGCGDSEVLRTWGDFKKIEASVKSSVREEDILAVLHTLAKLVVKELASDFQSAVDYRKGVKEEMNPVQMIVNMKKWNEEDEAMEWAKSKVEFFGALQSQLDTARGYLEGKSEYL